MASHVTWVTSHQMSQRPIIIYSFIISIRFQFCLKKKNDILLMFIDVAVEKPVMVMLDDQIQRWKLLT